MNFCRLALPDQYVSKVGSHEWLLEEYGFGAESIAQRIKDTLGQTVNA